MLCFQISICKYLVEQELFTLPEYMSLLSSFYGVRVAQSLVFCRAYFVFLFFFVWSLFCLSMYCFWLPLWYLKNLLTNVIEEIKITLFVLPNTYCAVFLFCLSLSCVPYVARFSGFSIFDCPFGIRLRFCNSTDENVYRN
jgi:hypothetical protein